MPSSLFFRQSNTFLLYVYLAIALWISWRRYVLLDTILCEESGDLLANELQLIVNEQRLQAAKPTDDVLSRESLDIGFLSKR